MNRTIKLIALSFFFALTSYSQANHVVISEFATRGGTAATDEFVELYNPTNAPIVIDGWKLEYKSATGTTWNIRANIPASQTIASHGYYLITPTSYTGSVVPDYRATEWSAGIADNGNLHIIDAGTLEVDKVGYGTGGDPEGSDAPNHGTTANNNSVERKAKSNSTSDSLCPAGLHALLGNGYDTNNNSTDFVVRTCGRDPQNKLSSPEPILCDGSGRANISPATMNGNDATNIVVGFIPDPQQTISDLRIIVPAAFTWSHQTTDISLSNATATVSVVSDTVLLEGIAITDSCQITINSVTASDSTASYSFHVQTRCSNFRDVAPLPSIVVFGSPIPISNVKETDANGIPLMNGQFVSLHGIVTAGWEFHGPAFMQDNTGGIALFGAITDSLVTIGDEITVSGKIAPFNGLNELTNLTLNQIVSQGNAIEPAIITTSQMDETFEGQLVKLLNVVVTDTFGNPIPTWAVSGSGTNYRLTDGTGFTQIRVDNNVDFANTPAPQGPFDVIGVVSQFDNSSPYTSGYQLQPRRASDIKAGGPTISQSPYETNLGQTSLTVSWKTLRASSSYLMYGVTDTYELGIVGENTPTRNHSVSLSGLTAATIYNVLAFSDSSGDTSFAQNLTVSTTSPNGTTGTMNVYFNKSVFTGLAHYDPALGNTNLDQKIINRINAAQRSIDVALYSLSGSNDGDLIATALVAAKGRGVKIRVIADHANVDMSGFTNLQSSGVPLIDNSFGTNPGTELMHNKFFVFDARYGGAPESVWVWTGSWNPTQPGTQNDMQNSIEIQDVSLANAYTREFEEMWGSNTEVPNSSNSRFGVRKTDNTPHHFIINDVNVESYFSPTDKPMSHLEHLIKSATHDVEMSIYSFTRNGVADSLIAMHNAGKQVRVAMDNNTDLNNVYSRLQGGNVDVKLKINANGLLHHKYAIIDALDTNALAWTWTGSANFTNAGEGSNNENDLAIQNNWVANQYIQEFAARYYQFGGTDSLRLNGTVGVREHAIEPNTFTLFQNYPNPFNPTTQLSFAIGHSSVVTLKVFDVLGREVATLLNNDWAEAGRHDVTFNAANLSSGMYFYRLTSGTLTQTKVMMLVK